MTQKEKALKKLEEHYHAGIKRIQDATPGHEISIILSIIKVNPENGTVDNDTDTSGRREELLVSSVETTIGLIMEYPDNYRSHVSLRCQAMTGESIKRLRLGNKTPPTVQELDALIEQAKLNHRVLTCPNTKLH
ncbi:hypothetical protein [Acetobacter persici]|uniref:Uncharacterized protein n=1 Tax=Acetobacter persici TaxID=1076596 RepID=A0A6V8IB83_9PROT|nr:hypothetical protein [Acetobacter persici]OUI90864.1 hypothetical protein HK19_08705 [Acetobacter persici]GFE94889.1 hypothetical protein DmAi_29480 [Acetobacter persici]